MTINQPSGNSEKQAISYGAPLLQEANAPVRLADILEQAALSAEKGVIYVQDNGTETFQSYSQLKEEAQRILAGLRKKGLQPHDPVIFQIETAHDYLPAFWGCILGGFVPVPISMAPTYRENNSTVSKLHNAWQMLGQPLILTNETRVAEIQALSTLLNLENFSVESVDALRDHEPTPDPHLSQPEDLTLLLLTSGSTGWPKAVMLNHRNLLSMTLGTSQKFEFSAEEVILNWMPLDHVGAIVCLMLMGVTNQAQQIHVPTDYILQNPLRWLDFIDRHQATISWAPNFAFALLNDRAQDLQQQSWNLSSMNFLINAGEQIFPKTIRSCLKLLEIHGLPTHATRPAFGMSETCSGITFSEGFSWEESSDEMSFVELGPPIHGAALRIVDEQSKVVAEEAVGYLQVKGPSVTNGYYQNPEKNAEVFSEEGWFTTGDMGYLTKGRLVLTGRDKDEIIIHGVNYYSHEIEAAIEELAAVETSYTAACSVKTEDSSSDQLAIFFNAPLQDSEALKTLMKQIRSVVVKNIGIHPDFLVPLKQENIPKTAIGKIQRAQLSKRFAEGTYDALLQQFGQDREKSAGHKGNLALEQELQKGVEAWLYHITWQPTAPVAPSVGPEKDPGLWLIFADREGLGKQLAEQLNAQGDKCVLIGADQIYKKLDDQHYHLNPEHFSEYQQLLQDCLTESSCHGVVHLWSLDDQEHTDLPGPDFHDFTISQRFGWSGILHLVQALTQSGSLPLPRLWIITRGAQAVGVKDTVPHIHQSPLWGLGRVIPMEHPDLPCVLLDLDPETEDNPLPLLFADVWTPDAETQIAYRQGKRHVARVTRGIAPQNHALDHAVTAQVKNVIQEKWSYLITGGCGGLGFTVAHWLVQQGARHLILLGRRGWSGIPTSEEARLVLRYFEEVGVQVLVVPVDVADREQMTRMLGEIQYSMPPLRGVIHAAGVLNDAMLRQQTMEDFQQVLQPKVEGSWYLHLLTRNLSLDFFISFSSIASQFASIAKANYAAANAFLDALAHHRQALGLPGLSINWGPWAEVGMAAREEGRYQERWAAQGFGALSPEKGLEALEQLLLQDMPQVTVLPVVWSAFLQQFHRSGQMSFFENFVQDFETGVPATSSQFLQSLETLPSHERYAQLQQHICQQVATVLKLESVASIAPQESLFDLGIDSLNVIELRDHLETSLASSFSSTLIFDYPTVNDLVNYIATEVLKWEQTSESNQSSNQEEPSILEKLNPLSEEEVGSLLDEKLNQLEKKLDL